jgi:NADH:ubiquinone oxidoreductase subunit E
MEETEIPSLVEKYNNSRTRLLDILQAVQNQYGMISESSID